MEDLLVGVVELDAGAELQETSGVGGDDGFRGGDDGMMHFVGQQFEGCFGLGDIVDSCGAAADFRVRQFHKLQAGDGAQELARGAADFLSVEKMARVLIGDAQRQRFERLQRSAEA